MLSSCLSMGYQVGSRYLLSRPVPQPVREDTLLCLYLRLRQAQKPRKKQRPAVLWQEWRHKASGLEGWQLCRIKPIAGPGSRPTKPSSSIYLGPREPQYGHHSHKPVFQHWNTVL